MRRKRPNPCHVKTHRNYTVEDISHLFGVHRGTVRNWIKKGLPIIDNKRPLLILGRDLSDFIKSKQKKNKRLCKPGEIYCVRCREPRSPAEGMADYESLTKSLGNIIGLCPDCGTLMYRRVNLEKLDQVRGQLDITMPKA